MNQHLKPVVVCVLALAWGLGWAWHTTHLRAKGRLDFAPNFASLGGSPYGKTLAFAVQGPVDVFWHASLGEEHHDHDHDHDHGHEHDHEHDDHGHESVPASIPEPAPDAVAEGGAKAYLERLGQAKEKANRAEGQRVTPAHARYLRRQVEDKLRFAWWLDPCNYVNFNALFLFLYENQLATRAVDLRGVIAVADQTMGAARSEMVNPEPWLTAAAAALSKLETLQRKARETPGLEGEIKKTLKDFGFCLSRHRFLRKTAERDGTWRSTPVLRREAMEQRAALLQRFYEIQSTILSRQNSPSNDTPPAPPSPQ